MRVSDGKDTPEVSKYCHTHTVRTIRVWYIYRTRTVRNFVPYAYGTKYAYGIEQLYH